MSDAEAGVELQQLPAEQQQPTTESDSQPSQCREASQQDRLIREHEQQEQQCHICMSSMKEPTAVKGCGHQFCHSCIQQWVSTRQQPCCPVCRAEVKFLVLADGTEQVRQSRQNYPVALASVEG
jgi:hypothetical protein